MDKLTDLIVTLSPEDQDLYINRLAEVAGPATAPHLILLDLADYHVRRLLDANKLSAVDRDHVERARLHLTMIKNIDSNSPVRRKALRSRIQALKQILQELRAKLT